MGCPDITFIGLEATNGLSGYKTFWVGGYKKVDRISFSCPPQLIFTPHFFKRVVSVRVWGLSHDFELFLGSVREGMLPVKYFHSNNSTLCVS